jgi:hypothetical protein
MAVVDSSQPGKKTARRAEQAKLKPKSPSTQAGEYVREEIEHVREGKHGARSAKQAIAIGLSKARRAGVKPNPKRSRAALQALEREGSAAVSHLALSRQAHSSARRRNGTVP